MKRGYDGQIPFYKDGDLAHYGDYNSVWRDNYEFTATLTFEGFERGRSAAYANFTHGARRYGVFLKDLAAMIPHLQHGTITGRFSFCKRGTNYGCVLLAVKEESK